MPGKLGRSPLANGPMYDARHDAEGDTQPPNHIVTTSLIEHPATEPNADTETRTISERQQQKQTGGGDQKAAGTMTVERI
jgi:hypothetical protein